MFSFPFNFFILLLIISARVLPNSEDMETALSTLAQVFVGPLIGTISDHYGHAILENIGVTWDVTEEMEKLFDILLTIQDVIEDAEDKQVTNKPIRNWLRKLKDIAYDVDDLLDECATEALYQPETAGSIGTATMVRRIKQLIDKFDKITEQRYKFALIDLNSATRAVHSTVDLRRETSSFSTELKVYGRDEENKNIVNLLVNNIADQDLSIYAIFGIAGLGKTTLAQMVFNNNMVKRHFHIRIWVCVSENFELKTLIQDIIQSRSNYVQTLNELQCRLQEELSGKKFLLVLDDVWNKDQTKLLECSNSDFAFLNLSIIMLADIPSLGYEQAQL